MQPILFQNGSSQTVVQVFGGVGERREDNHLPVACVDGMGKLVAQVGNQLLQLAVVFRSDGTNHEQQKIKVLQILFEVAAPCDVVKILQGNSCLLATDKHIRLSVIGIEIPRNILQFNGKAVALIQHIKLSDG